MAVLDRLKHAWNVFMNVRPVEPFQALGSYGTRPDRLRPRYVNEKTIYQSILARIALDFSAVEIKHVRVDDQGRYESDIDSGLNSCLDLEANLASTSLCRCSRKGLSRSFLRTSRWIRSSRAAGMS